MKIAASSVAMDGTYELLEKHEKRERLRDWVGDRRPDFEAQTVGPVGPVGPVTRDAFLFSEEARAALAKKTEVTELTLTEEDERKLKLGPRELIKLLLIETLTGIKMELPLLDLTDRVENKCAPVEKSAAAPAQSRQGWGVEYDYFESHYEYEKMTFSAEGTVKKTADGTELRFKVQLSMERESLIQKNISTRAGDATIDPLVVNFDGAGAQLTDARFAFDLNTDGKQDRISFVRSGSGFLALDRNSDGVINDGSELFGPQSGDGFAELARYDEDNNGWIDENDAVFVKLSVWTKDPSGNDSLLDLKQVGIGAIYLRNVDTPFAVKDNDDRLRGQVRRSGIYLNENGSPGTMQQVDLAI